MRRPGPTVAILCALAAFPAAAQPAHNQVVADLSSPEIAINTGFTGTDLLLFGAVQGTGDIVVVVRGPVGSQLVRKKDRVAGIWVNRESLGFAQVPSFYRVASSRPLNSVMSPELQKKYEIGLGALKIEPESIVPDKMATEYRAALIRALDRHGYFDTDVGRVRFVDGGLFRTTIAFPANVPTGTYSVIVYLFRNGALISKEETPLKVYKVGMEAEIFRFAHDRSALYGVIAITIALVAGWLAGVAFRNV